MSEEKHCGLSESHKNVAIEIQNILAGISVYDAIQILNSTRNSILDDSHVKGFNAVIEPISVRIG